MNQFNFTQFCDKYSNDPLIKSIKQIHSNIIKITFVDNQILYIDTFGDEYHKFFTSTPERNDAIYYMGQMPHSSYEDLYEEIDRMKNPASRRYPCKYPYFKGDLFM